MISAPRLTAPRRLRTLLICHAGADLHEKAVVRWLAASTDLVGVLVVAEGRAAILKRARRQLQRVGALRFLDVVLFRLYYTLFLRRADARCERDLVDSVVRRFSAPSAHVPHLVVPNPNRPEAERFIRQHAPDLTLALCKNLLKEAIFSIPPLGTFVLHPGICPEYRNAHGCFWALASGDLANVGLTLLRVDSGIDTGPIFGYYRCSFDEVRESHVRIQHRLTIENLDSIMATFARIARGEARPIDTSRRRSATWGQPWLTSYLRWKTAARRRVNARDRVAVS